MDGTVPNNDDRRRRSRYTLAVPIDIVALRSGVPASIPGRTVNLSEHGVATVLAGELSPGEAVGLEFRLPLLREAIQAKAIVRHYSLMQCGLQFVALPAEQENALRTWTQMAGLTQATTPPAKILPAPATRGEGASTALARNRGLHWLLMSAGLVTVVLAAVSWWSWNSGWRELEGTDTAPGNAAAVPLDVSSSLMEQRIIHRVDPIYPREAANAKIQGEVTLEVLIGEDGTVRDAYAVSGPDALRTAAVDAVRWWRFEPYRVNGHSTPVHTSMEVDFRLNQ